MIKRRIVSGTIAVALAAMISGCTSTTATSKVSTPSFTPVTAEEIINDDKTTGDVLTYGLGQKG